MISLFVSPSIKQFFTPVLSNIGVGISLTLFQTLICSSHYHQLFINNDIIINNFLLTSFTYGYDRYKDAIEYSQKNKESYSLSKQYLYDSILKYENIYITLYNLILIIIQIRFNIHNEQLALFSFLTFLSFFL